ncbi:MAG: peptidase A8 [Rhodothermaceae bacterium]|nr:peptidase A8 [Rhodothermaceae bacterium]
MRVLWVTLLILAADQITKVWVKLTMLPQESIPVLGNFFRLTFTENPGMAFGLSLGSKLFLTLFSLVATVLIGVYLWHVRKGPTGYRVALALILGGALGNIIDRVFYGLIWGYDRLFYGNVVDFIHFDIWRGVVPESVPLLGGRYFAIFPIGNIADLAIIGGVAAIILFQRRFHNAMVEAESARAEMAPAMEPVASVAPPVDGMASVPPTPMAGEESAAG